jgi:hypothetical protein
MLSEVWAPNILRSWIIMLYGYGSIPINTIFREMNIHKSQLFWCSLPYLCSPPRYPLDTPDPPPWPVHWTNGISYTGDTCGQLMRSCHGDVCATLRSGLIKCGWSMPSLYIYICI